MYEWKRWGNHKFFEFTTVKLLDYRKNWEQLAQDPNPFAMVVMAQLKTLELKTKSNQLLAWKLQLARLLRERQWAETKITGIFRFLDWVMALPEDLEIVFEEELEKEENPMPYLSPMERRIEKRIEQRVEKQVEQRVEKQIEQRIEKRTTLEVIVRLLNARFGQLEPQQEQQLNELGVQQLSNLVVSQVNFKDLHDFEAWLEANPPTEATEGV